MESSSGFLGSFSGTGNMSLRNISTDGFMYFVNADGDEIDLWAIHDFGTPCCVPTIRDPFPVGINNLSFTGWDCKSQACLDAVGQRDYGWGHVPTSQASVVTPVLGVRFMDILPFSTAFSSSAVQRGVIYAPEEADVQRSQPQFTSRNLQCPADTATYSRAASPFCQLDLSNTRILYSHSHL